ncbi:MAG TPA: hypothetical protein GYA07_14790 [Verrucomicrobia bacterium]|nr:hypothetical protein [Verrucomicrobiota bacterium]HOP97202.1 hypothetical protein [Verrucomicrobiota bacterium]
MRDLRLTIDAGVGARLCPAQRDQLQHVNEVWVYEFRTRANATRHPEGISSNVYGVIDD